VRAADLRRAGVRRGGRGVRLHAALARQGLPSSSGAGAGLSTSAGSEPSCGEDSAVMVTSWAGQWKAQLVMPIPRSRLHAAQRRRRLGDHRRWHPGQHRQDHVPRRGEAGHDHRRRLAGRAGPASAPRSRRRAGTGDGGPGEAA
jgi:hypothetical protein